MCINSPGKHALINEAWRYSSYFSTKRKKDNKTDSLCAGTYKTILMGAMSIVCYYKSLNIRGIKIWRFLSLTYWCGLILAVSQFNALSSSFLFS